MKNEKLIVFGKRLKELRIAAKRTQPEMGELLNCTKSNYQKIEYGEINIPITCFYGQDDSLVPYSNIQKWKEFTEKETRFFACRGNHFFVYDTTNANYISNIISEGFK